MSNKKNILFRADSSNIIGTGHIMRDLVLASQYPNTTIYFACQELPGNINSKIIDSRYTLKTVASNSTSELITLIQDLNIDL